MNNELCFGQRIDHELGILEPWYVNAAVDRIKQMDLSEKVVMEWGGGGSTLWWSFKARKVYSVDHNLDWFTYANETLKANSRNNAQCFFVATHEGDQTANRDLYINPFGGMVKPDVCIADGIHRYECAEYAVKVLKPEILIVDNHQQDYVFMCPSLDILLEGVRMERFIQTDHLDHSGNPWATAIFYLNEKS